jgi:bifunctional UDP-N-acetylglucosamine pyrophosphorylase/glucosamine-1-phosphate N-acetyltransferase
LVWYAIETARQVSEAGQLSLSVYRADEVRRALGEAVDYAIQEQQLGTGHAVMQASAPLKVKPTWSW